MEGGASRMTDAVKKKCVVLNGKVIHIGEWDDQLPEGAIIEERDFEYDVDRGWYEVGTIPEPTTKERIEALELAMLEMILGGIES